MSEHYPSMADATQNSSNDVMRISTSQSQEHLCFAETLRDWHDPLLQGYERISVPLCPRCAVCKCESLKDFRNGSFNAIPQHHKHEPTCPTFRHNHGRSPSSSPQGLMSRCKRRAVSLDPAIAPLNTSSSSSSITKSISPVHSPLSHITERKKPKSNVSIRVSTPTKNLSTTPKKKKNQPTFKKIKFPLPIVIPSSPLSTIPTSDLYEDDR